jgi:SAM-dependent methyltransferase
LYPGLQDKSWVYQRQDFTCDILDIPTSEKFDLVLCTEVLEHVPDPVQALKALVELAAPDGYIIITVPLSSLIHQAPYYFASGLSPYFFEYWCEKLELSIIQLDLSGAYTDAMTVEIERLFSPFRLGVPLIKLNKIAIRLISNRISKQIQTSSGFNTLLVARKIG